MPRIVLKCAPGGTIWTILGQHLENRVFKPKNSILFGVPRIIMKSAPGGTVWTISGERLENALSKGPLWPAVFMVFQNGVRSKLQFHFKRRSLKACKRFAGALGCFLQVLKGLCGGFLEAFWKLFGGLWEAFGRLLGAFWRLPRDMKLQTKNDTILARFWTVLGGHVGSILEAKRAPK